MARLEADKPIRLKDIAQRCGISAMTVSCALRGNGRISTETAEHVREVAREMGYDPSRHSDARRLRANGHTLSNAIGLVFDNAGLSRTNYFTYLFRGVLDGVKNEEFEVVASDSTILGQEHPLPIIYRKGDIDGVLAVGTRGDSHWQVLYRNLRTDPAFASRPIVGLMEHLDDCSAVHADHSDAGYKVLSHLLDLGHKRIVLTEDYEPAGCSTRQLRSIGYRNAFHERGLDPAECLLSTSWNWAPRLHEERQQDLIGLLTAHPDATAIVAWNDCVAGVVYTALVRSGIRVPEDISLISYDNTDPIYDASRENMLTGVHTPLAEIGAEGARLLIRRVTGGEQEDRDIVMPVQLIVRSSTAPPAPQCSLQPKELRLI
jgi:DNA-binding LacI/PurR family transcriptional regulator